MGFGSFGFNGRCAPCAIHCLRIPGPPRPPCTDTIPPVLLPEESFPAPGSTAFFNQLPIIIQFSEPVFDVSSCNFVVTADSGAGPQPVLGVVRFAQGDDSAMFIPSQPYGPPGITTVFVTVGTGVDCPITDECGNILSPAQQYTFNV